jgi:hypothetical protein
LSHATRAPTPVVGVKCINMQSFETGKMISGALFLVLQNKIRWEDFPDLSKEWSRRLGARTISEPIISVDECLLGVKIGEGSFWITYDDFQSAIHLEPKANGYDEIINSLQAKLRAGT